MNKDWDKAVVSVDTWKECIRVLKSGSFAFIMSSPRQDVLCKMILNLIDAGFETNYTSIYWAYASGFPKAANISKLVDKRNGRNQDIYKPFADYLKQKRLEKKLSMNEIDRMLGTNTAYSWWEGRLSGIQLPSKFYYEKLKTLLDLDNRFDELIEREEAEREIIGKSKTGYSEILGHKIKGKGNGLGNEVLKYDITKSATEAAKRLDGSYCGFNPKPALETILVVMKPLSEKSYVDQSLKNGKGITWLDDCRIPFQSEKDKEHWHFSDASLKNDYRQWSIEQGYEKPKNRDKDIQRNFNEKGRFPANLIVSDDSLNDGKISKLGKYNTRSRIQGFKSGKYSGNIGFGEYTTFNGVSTYGDSGSYSRYFDLDKWYDNRAQFIITPKASASERNKGLETNEGQKVNDGRKTEIDNPFQRGETIRQNSHPTVKPLKLMSYLITMGSRPNDIILDPFCGSGTTCIAALQLGRQYIGIEKEKEYCEIARNRLKPYQSQTKLLNFSLTEDKKI
jgi:hypothetical protein